MSKDLFDLYTLNDRGVVKILPFKGVEHPMFLMMQALGATTGKHLVGQDVVEDEVGNKFLITSIFVGFPKNMAKIAEDNSVHPELWGTKVVPVEVDKDGELAISSEVFNSVPVLSFYAPSMEYAEAVHQGRVERFKEMASKH